MYDGTTKLCLFNLLSRYSRPPVRPQSQAIHEPSQLLNTKSDISTPAGKRDTLWKLARIIKRKEQHVPSWSAFNAFITDKSPPVVAVRYMPFIRASPTDYSTIYPATALFLRNAGESIVPVPSRCPWIYGLWYNKLFFQNRKNNCFHKTSEALGGAERPKS